MANPTKSAEKGKPAKPPDFPLFPHATRMWAKKVLGTLRCFGPWSDPHGADWADAAASHKNRCDLHSKHHT